MSDIQKIILAVVCNEIISATAAVAVAVAVASKLGGLCVQNRKIFVWKMCTRLFTSSRSCLLCMYPINTLLQHVFVVSVSVFVFT
jgi:hypothetical protein